MGFSFLVLEEHVGVCILNLEIGCDVLDLVLGVHLVDDKKLITRIDISANVEKNSGTKIGTAK